MNPFRLDSTALAFKATMIRKDIIEMLVSAGSGHSAGPLGMADVFTALYFSVLSHRPDDPKWQDRDRLVLSCGHIGPVLYACLAETGYFQTSSLSTFRQFGSPLQGHPSRLDCPGVETSSGPLGQGISQAIGMALALRMAKNPAHVYCVVSDGEHNEGQLWEALLFASKYQLSNLTLIIDRNDIQISGSTQSVMPLEPLCEKYESFNWHVIEIDGHNTQEILDACSVANAVKEKPSCIIAHTIPGKGVSFMENNFEWHGKTPNKEEAKKALEELSSTQGTLT